MDWCVRLALLALTTLCLAEEDWDTPPFTEPDNGLVTLVYEEDDPANAYTKITMDEELSPPITIAIINYHGETKPSITSFELGNNEVLGATVEGSNEAGWSLVVNNRIDYEQLAEDRFSFRVSSKHDVVLWINNIDDNPPAINPLTNPCYIEENDNTTEPECFYEISDADGWLPLITWKIEGSRGDEETMFEFKWVDEGSIGSTTKQAMARLQNKVALDYETYSAHVLTWILTDSGGNQGQQIIIVNVIDLPDTPPRWTQIFSVEQFDEKTAQEFIVTAIDGDVSINDNILYSLISDYNDLFSIDEATGVITVSGIDRDALQQEIFSFTIRATEEHEPNFYTDQSVTFIVDDLNDNSPTIINPSSKTLDLKIPEALITDLDFTIDIIDIDSSENAIYTVTLLEKYGEAFQVVPSRGYQEYSFSMSIINSVLLDYEDEEWRQFQFTMFVQETKDDTHTDLLTINVELLNWNDESPIFEKDSYVVSVREDIAKGAEVATVKATDRDVDDSVVYALTGSSANRILAIDTDQGIISTLTENAFDYERQTEMVIQVSATDTLVDDYGTRHTTYVELTINVEDVNDETPRITVGSTATIPENQEHDTPIDIEITATDEDTTAELIYNINWEKSSATKSGRQASSEDYDGCVTVETEYIDGSKGYARAKLKINEIVKDNTPDYEKFDTLFLSLTVTDLNQYVNEGTDTVSVTIFIEDKNDNKPVFTEDSIKANNTVTEAAASGVSIGTITATDEDGPGFNEVKYYLSPVEGTPDGLVTIDSSSGLLSVTSTEISADNPEERYYLSYYITASDGEWDTTEQINIFIIDTNNNDPIFEDFEESYTIKEKSPNNTLVVKVKANDKDRDPPYNVVWYGFPSTISSSALEFFNIDVDKGELRVIYRFDNIYLDRDEGIGEFTVLFRAGDDRYGSYQRRTEDQIITITLEDINDQYPIVETESITVSEQLKEGERVSTPIVANDKDDPNTDNAKIDFEIIDLKDSDENSVEDLFVIAESDTSGIAYLETVKDLEGYYGEYTLTVKTSDRGINPETNEHNSMENYVKVVVEKYNFFAPVFTYPTDDLKVYLSKTQQTNTYLYLSSGERLPNIQADDRQDGKWDIQFDIDETESTEGCGFTISNSEAYGRSTGVLQLKEYPNDWDTLCKLHIIANDYGTPPLTSSVYLNVRFFDPDSQPYFAEGERELKISFTENSTGLTEKQEIYSASYNYGEDEDDWDIFYLLLEGDGDLFAVDIEKGDITLKEELDREEVERYELKILSSNRQSIPANYDDKSVLVVEVEVLDINDNPPHFDKSYYSNGISTINAQQSTVITVSAYDLDKNENLTFAIDYDSLTAVGSGISDISTAFTIDENTGAIILGFKVQANMDGYFYFEITVTDSPPQNHQDRASVQIFIITDSNRVELIFENSLNTVVQLQHTVQEILQTAFGYTCNIESILSNTDENGEAIESQTVVTIHFVDPEQNAPINKTEIQSKLSDIEFFTSLRSMFINSTLYLLSYASTSTATDNIEEQLRAWLIAVTVILGSLCLVLLVAFILKTRSLTQRLNNLSTIRPGSQESGINRLGIALPNTNKNALECSNPLYNEEKKMPELDQTSVHSGDSELIGVEDNPEFDYPAQNGTTVKEKY